MSLEILRREKWSEGEITVAAKDVPESQLWTLEEPHSSRIARGLTWAAETDAKDSDPDTLLKGPEQGQRRLRARRK
jgi:hypothetical protein